MAAAMRILENPNEWRPERGAAFPPYLPDSPEGLDPECDHYRVGMAHRSGVEFMEARNAARLLDVVWAGRAMKRVAERTGDETAQAAVQSLSRMLREQWHIAGPVPEKGLEEWAAKVTRRPSSCPMAWRRGRRK